MPPTRAAQILVAEDQTDIRDLLVMNLRTAGYEVSAVGDGEQALARQVEQPADLLILDLMMPRRDGFSVLRELRTDGRIANLPVIVVTAIFGLSERLYATELGAADYVTKPFELDELLERVRNALASRRAEPASSA